MIGTEFYGALVRTAPDWLVVDLHVEVLSTFPEGKWFTPTNEKDEAATICETLFNMHLICRCQTPIWIRGSFGGMRTQYLYRSDLKYPKMDDKTA